MSRSILNATMRETDWLRRAQAKLEQRTQRVENGCLEWQGARDPNGYGNLMLDKVWWRPHRLAWVVQIGLIPDGLAVWICSRVPERQIRARRSSMNVPWQPDEIDVSSGTSHYRKPSRASSVATIRSNRRCHSRAAPEGLEELVAKMANGGTVWLTVIGALFPHRIEVRGPDERVPYGDPEEK